MSSLELERNAEIKGSILSYLSQKYLYTDTRIQKGKTKET